MRSLDWFRPEPFFAINVSDFAIGRSQIIDDSADGFPKPLSQLAAGEYRCQAIFDQDLDFPNPANGPGNVFSRVCEVTLDPAQPTTISIDLDQVVQPRELRETEFIKFVELPSAMLSKFHQRSVVERAGIVLPASYHDAPNRRYPVFYEVSGFGGSLSSMTDRGQRKSSEADGKSSDVDSPEIELIRVMLTGECKWGHHVYANSQTNGPRGDALIQELIPHIDRNFRTVNHRDARFVGGHSSGGWSSLWLQIQYPETFGGVWSSSPDPVDFRDWQGTNLYADPVQSVFTDLQGLRRPLARRGTSPVLMYDEFCKMDDSLGRGGQLRSFEAVFGPLDANRLPKRCWDRTTGQIDPKVAEYWKRYDISLILQEHWPELAPWLTGRVHVVIGELDTFYLEGATKLLAERLKSLGSDASVEIVPDRDHGNLLSSEIRQRRHQQMTAIFLKQFTVQGQRREVVPAK